MHVHTTVSLCVLIDNTRLSTQHFLIKRREKHLEGHTQSAVDQSTLSSYVHKRVLAFKKSMYIT